MTDTYIPYSTQDICEADIEAVVAALKDPLITQGPAIGRFEKTIQDYCNVPHAVALSSATAGLHVAMAALDVGPGTRVWAPPMTFVGTTNAARMLGAEVSFVDVEAATGNISVSALQEKLAKAQRDNVLPHVLVVVHFAGRVCDMSAINNVCKPYNIAIIEDAAHALGAGHTGSIAVGHAHLSQACVFSFHPVKSITTGEGGLVTSRDAALADRMRRLRSHGTTRNPGDFTSPAAGNKDHGAWYYEQLELGYNYRLTDIQAALGASQMTRLDEFIAARRQRANRYTSLLDGLPLQLPPASDLSAWHLYVIQLAQDAKTSRRELFDTLRAENIGVNVHYIPVHLQPYYARLGFRPGDYPVSEGLYAGALSLPLYPKLTEQQQDRVAAVVRRVLE
ncbi:MAG: UDP-4-amino-4,6-dideoxy-N-acetyl-beta-L-altrosamine transaminase [Rhizobiales bacterium]|nr:UDP-4-amino-4,6-dideoxy-N-acetyl-beta-L-altrosamine transaminase [Hyphomicrobiales bacterium]